MATRQQSLTPLIDIESAAFAAQYERGVWWSMYGDELGQGPVPASYLVTNLKDYAEHDYFSTNDLTISITSVSFSAYITVVSSHRKQASVAQM